MNDFRKQAMRLESIGGQYDFWLVAAAAALAAIGVVMVASASIAMAATPYYYLSRHVVFLALGVGLAITAMRMELKSIEKYNQLLLLGCFALLVVVFVPGLGSTVNGARRWINLGFTRFQTVEAVKVLYIVWLASYLVRFRDEVLVLIALLLLQPDFGSSTLLLGITAGMLILGGANLPRMTMPVLALLPALVALVVFEPYRMRRVTSFLDPWKDQLGSGYQLSNALMAIGRGEWTGVGLGSSVQKLNYLPEAHTDFIFSVIGEELGFLGVCAIIGLYALLVGRALYVGYRCVGRNRHFAGYIAFGIALWIGMQAFVSIGVNLGLLPTKGLTLPLISSGGSSVLGTCAAIGLLLRVSYELDRAERQVARLRGESTQVSGGVPSTAQPVATTAVAMTSAPALGNVRGTSRLRDRVEPTFGRSA
jgi:cell division protein FtsW